MNRWFGILGIFFFSIFAAGQAIAQGGPPPAQPAQATQESADGQQQQGVGRVSLLRGDVSTQRGDSGDWVAATLNTPVMAGDKVSTADRANAELQLDFANILRLSGKTEATIASLGGNHIQIQLALGLVDYTVFKSNDSDIEIDTPNVSVRPTREGTYRIQVNSDGETVVIVREGEAEITTSEGSATAGRGEMVTIQGSGADAQYKKDPAPSTDEWDKWNADRDRTIQSAASWNHVDPYYTGANDLDASGQWSSVPDYGDVWTPNVDSDWSPYSAGNWVWEPYYGWTWVSNEPWGWAPYHYGRWFRNADRWSWWPGLEYGGYRPIWAPAYVSFFGFGGDFGVGVGFGFDSIGWLPIGPCDPFFPWYGFGVGVGFRFGFHDFAEFRDFRFRDRDDFHRRFPHGVEPLRGRFDERGSNFHRAEHDPGMLRGVNSVRADQFGHGAVAHNRGITSGMLRNSHFTSGSVPAAPTHASLSVTNRSPNPSTIRNNQGTHFFGSRNQTQGGGQRTSFNEQAGRLQQAVRTNGASSGGGGMNGGIRSNGNGPGNSMVRSNNGNNSGTQTMHQQSGNDRAPGFRSFEGQGTQRPSITQSPANNSRQNNGGQNNGFQRNGPQNGGPQNNGRQNNGGGWQHFTPQPGQGGQQQGPGQPRYQGGQQPYGSGRPNPQGGNSRPPLDMHRPVVNQRAPASNGGNRYNGGAPPTRPTYGGGYAPPSRPSGGYAPPSRPSGGYAPPSRPSGGYAPPSRPSGGGYSPPPRSSGGGGGGGYHGSSGGSSHGSSGGSHGSSSGGGHHH